MKEEFKMEIEAIQKIFGLDEDKAYSLVCIMGMIAAKEIKGAGEVLQELSNSK